MRSLGAAENKNPSQPPTNKAMAMDSADITESALTMTGADASEGEASTSGRDWSWVPYPEGHRKRRGFIANYLDTVKGRENVREAAYAPSVREALDGEAFATLRRGATVRFDPNEYELLEAFLALIDTSGLAAGDDDGDDGDIDLAKIHERLPDFDRGKSHLEDKARILAPLARPGPKRDRFRAAYDRLMLTVVAPHFAARMPGEKRLLYASFPCVRVQQPCDFHTIRAHVDTMYLHPHGSLNVWLPLTTTRGVNTLHVESAPGAEDFAPIELSLGELAVFDGARCAHFTVANTSDRTRVSLDFRVIPSTVYDADAHISRVKGTGSQCYNVGGYYSVACRDEKTNEWVRTVTGTPSIRHGFPHANPEIVEE